MRSTLPQPTRRPSTSRRNKILALTSLGVAGLIAGLLTGCSGSSVATPAAAPATSATTRYDATTGNWQFTSGALRFAGALTASGTTVSGRLHAVNMACTTAASFPVSGSVADTGALSLTSTGFPGGSLTIQGTLAADQHSLTTPTLTLSGGTCAPLARTLRPQTDPNPVAQQYQPITGAYTGTFTDTDGDAEQVNATLSQPTTPDSNGVYHLTGTATFANNPCLASPVVTDSTVSGADLSTTYTDSSTGASITASGTFSSDASTLTISSWTFSGPCGTDSGTGLLTR